MIWWYHYFWKHTYSFISVPTSYGVPAMNRFTHKLVDLDEWGWVKQYFMLRRFFPSPHILNIYIYIYIYNYIYILAISMTKIEISQLNHHQSNGFWTRKTSHTTTYCPHPCLHSTRPSQVGSEWEINVLPAKWDWLERAMSQAVHCSSIIHVGMT